MHTINIWNQFDLHRKKIILVVLVLLSVQALGQQRLRYVPRNNPNYDERKFSYGFLIGLHSGAYQIEYSDKFVTPAFDTLHSVVPAWKSGFSLGFLVNYRLTDLLDLRVTPLVAFYEHSLQYNYTDDTPTNTVLVETTMVEIPLLLKYKSERRGNIRMFLVGGVKPSIEASGRKELDGTTNTLEVKGVNLALDAGFGLDLYYPLFKFSPEIRFSRGMIDILDNRQNSFGQPLNRVNTNMVSLYLVFQ